MVCYESAHAEDSLLEAVVCSCMLRMWRADFCRLILVKKSFFCFYPAATSGACVLAVGSKGVRRADFGLHVALASTEKLPVVLKITRTRQKWK